jgi:hypothetical protein
MPNALGQYSWVNSLWAQRSGKVHGARRSSSCSIGIARTQSNVAQLLPY